MDTIENIKQLGDDDLDLDELKELVNNKKNENLYTEDSYKNMQTFMLMHQNFNNRWIKI